MTGEHLGASRPAHSRALTLPIMLAGSLAVTGALAAPAAPRPADAHDGSRSAGRAGTASGAHDTISPAPTATAAATRHAAAPARLAPASAAPHVYTVRTGDTVSGIAERYGLSTPAVLALNGLSWNSTIFPGQRLALTGTDARAPHRASAADRTPHRSTAAATHTVVAGDTVSGIAARAGVSTAAVLDANGLDADSIIRPGQRLVVPRPGPRVAARSTAPRPRAAEPDTRRDAPSRAADTQAITAEMRENARTIIEVGRSEHVPDRGIVVALAAAIQESGLRNLPGGDRDSVGLFQQRPSMGWGTPAQLRDPRYAATAFYGGAHNPHPDLIHGLLDIPGWRSMPIAAAAQAVQISAEPDSYGLWVADAEALLAALG